jgi:hypothetical protein
MRESRFSRLEPYRIRSLTLTPEFVFKPEEVEAGFVAGVINNAGLTLALFVNK